jgi:molybdopterin molybdotransferase
VNRFSDPDSALRALAQRLACVDTEIAPLSALRVLAEPILADRDSPAADVSAMDGYALRMSDLARDQWIDVAGEIQPGEPAPELPVGAVVRIFTGAVVPSQAQAVIKREDTSEQPAAVRWTERAATLQAGANIRRRGENAVAGSEVIPAGTLLSAASVAAAVNFGVSQASVHRAVRCSAIVTGNELLGAADSPEPWQLRDSNGPTIAAMIADKPWLLLSSQTRCGDDRQRLTETLMRSLQQSDAVILTGGVSKGDYDFVPDVIRQAGGEIIFHGLPIRPGQPILGAVTPRGQLILGLPGNPVSAACGMLRIGVPLLKKLSGNRQWQPQPAGVILRGDDDKTLPLHWMRLVRLIGGDDRGCAEAQLVRSMGSGDLVALAASDGFIQQPPGGSGAGPWPFFRW